MARAQARTAGSILQLTSSVAALVQHAGLTNALPPTPPALPLQTFAAIAAAPAPAGGATVASESDAVMDVTAAGAPAPAEAPAAGPSWHEAMTPASTGGPTHTGAAPSAEMDLNDDSMPVPDEAPVSRRTRLSLALASMLPSSPSWVVARPTFGSSHDSPAPGTAQGTVEGPPTWAAMTRRVSFADEHEWDDEYDASTDDERGDSGYVFFGDEDDDGSAGDDDSTSQHEALRRRKQWRIRDPTQQPCSLVGAFLLPARVLLNGSELEGGTWHPAAVEPSVSVEADLAFHRSKWFVPVQPPRSTARWDGRGSCRSRCLVVVVVSLVLLLGRCVAQRSTGRR